MDRIGELAEAIRRYGMAVQQEIAEPWRSALLGIDTQLSLALETFQSLRVATAQEIVASAERLTQAQMASARRDLLPPRPVDASELTTLDRKADIVRLLDRQSSDAELADFVLTLAAEASRDRDDLTVYCLAGGPLDFYFRARQVDPVAMRDQILALLGKSFGVPVLHRLIGPRGIAALVLETRQTLVDPEVLESAREEMLTPKRMRSESGGEDLDEEQMQEFERGFSEIAAMASELWEAAKRVEPPQPE